MFDSKIYINRRDRLKKRMKNGVALFLGNMDSPMNYKDNTFPFRQDSSFLYLFGLDFPGLAGVIDFDNGVEFIFGNDAGIDDIIWMGPQVPLRENAAKAGITETAPLGKLDGYISEVIRQGRKVHILPPYRCENKLWLEQLLGISPARLSDFASVELIQAVVDLRSVKEPCEVEEMIKACVTGYEMHIMVMKMARPGVREQEIAGIIEGIASSGGGMPAFPVILSQNGETLHNHDHSQLLKKGRLVLTDAGAESSLHYASDFTRTVPVGGKFSRKQRDIYEIVLAANNRAKELIRPGVPFKSIHMEACEVMASGLIELGLMKGDVKEAVQQGAHALFFPHGLGHMLGLDAHDMEDLGQIYVGFDEEIRPSVQFGTASLRLGRRLKPGFVVTNEPGIYFIPALIDMWEKNKTNAGFICFDKVNEYRDFGGIRLEDDILVTETGSEIIGKRVPVNPDEVERIVSENQ